MAETRINGEDILDLSIKTEDLDSGSVHPVNANLSASWNFASGSLFYKTPVAVDEVAIKSYVDAVAFGSRDPKDAVRVAASASIALTGTFTLDDISLNIGDRVLAFGQDDATANGIYVVTSSAWPRSEDADGTPAGEVTQGLYTLVATGTIWEGVGFILTNDDPITVDVDDLNFVQFTALGKVVAGAGLTKTGNQLDVGAGYGIEVLPDSVQIDGDIVPDKTGSNTFTGDNTFSAGLTGSLQQVTAGQSYLVEGTNISITSGANGSITISADTQQDSDWQDNGGNLSTTSSLNVENEAWFAGPVTSTLGFSGSLTRLADGSSYLVEGFGIDITSASNGSVTIAVDATVLDDGDWQDNGDNLSTTSSLNVENEAWFAGPVTSTLGFSGSLTRLADGSSYLVEGTGIDITSASNGSVTVAVDSGSVVTFDRFVYGEHMTGTFPGTTFETAFAFASASLRIYRRGLRMFEGASADYVIVNNQRFTLAQTTTDTSNLQVDYIKAN